MLKISLPFIVLVAICCTTNAQHQTDQYGPLVFEVRFEKLDNPEGIHDDGSSCSLLTECSMRIRVRIDTASYNATWPGAVEDTQSWLHVHVPRFENTHKLGRTLQAQREPNQYTTDAAGNVMANFRVLVQDKRFLRSAALIDRFSCLFSQIPANSSRVAQWTPPLEVDATPCYGEVSVAANRPRSRRPVVFYRWRIYRKTAGSSPALDDASSSTSPKRFGDSVTSTAVPGRSRKQRPDLEIEDTEVTTAKPSSRKSSSSTDSSESHGLFDNIGSVVGTAIGAAVGTALGTTNDAGSSIVSSLTGGGISGNDDSASGSDTSDKLETAVLTNLIVHGLLGAGR